MASADAGQTILTKFYLYSTASRYYLVGRCKLGAWSVCTLLRGEPDLQAHETTSALSQPECGALLRQIHAGNSLGTHGGLQLVCKAYGVIGCAKFLEGHYLLLVTKRQYQGSLCGHKVYSISDTALVPLVQASAQSQESMAEKRYRKLLLGMDLTQDFFFSYTYNIAATLQKNLTTMAAEHDRFDSMFVWNDHLTKPLRCKLGNDRWVVPLIHGFWQQRTLAVFGQTLTITLVARRSRHFAGTRYQKRGVNHEGRVANDVETEQIVWAGLNRRNASPSLSSVVQVRGSIPLYWNQQQQGSRLSKPDILLQTFDPLYSATRAHLEDMQARYGSPVVCLDLVKAIEKNPREIALRMEFDTAISYINQAVPEEDRVHHVPFDLNYHAKQHGPALLDGLVPLLDACLDVTGLLVHKSPAGPQVVQRGVLRTNCIDCLDRTNVAQFAAGLAALGRQLAALGISDGPSIDARSSLARHLMDLYEATGNTLARQYGGSEAHSTFFQRQRGDWEAATQGRDLMTSIRRFYSNAYTDSEKQAAINLFLGNFVPQAGRPALWELDSDYYLHYSSGTSLKRAGSSSGSLSRAASAELARPAAASGGGAADVGSPIQAGSLWRLPGPRPYAGSPQPGALGRPGPFGARRSLDGASSTTRTARVLAEEAAAAEMLRRAARAEKRLQPLWQRPAGGGGGGGPCTFPQDRSQQHQYQQPLARTVQADMPVRPRPSSAPQAARPAEHEPPAPQLESSQLDGAQQEIPQPGSSVQAGDAAPVPEPAALAQDTAPDDASPGIAGGEEPAAGAEIAPAQGGPPPVMMPPPARRRAKLESLDKLIGQQPDVVHQVRLQAAPSQRAYLPQWLAAPLGRRRTGREAAPPVGSGALPPIAEHGSSSGSRRISADLSHLTSAAPPPPPLSRVRRTQSTDSGLLRLVRSVQLAPERRAGGSPPGASLRVGDSLWEAGDPLPPLRADREALAATGGGPRPPSPPLQLGTATAPDMSPDIALTDAAAAGRAKEVPVSAPKLGALLAAGPTQLGISPFLLAYWVGSPEHFAAAIAAEVALAKHYSRFIAESQSFLEPPERLRKHYEDLCQVPALVEGI